MTQEPQDTFLAVDPLRVLQVAGPSERFLALIEQAFLVHVEMPGTGFLIKGENFARASARQALERLINQAEAGHELTERDVKSAVSSVKKGSDEDHTAFGAPVIVGRRGAVSAKTKGQAEYVERLRTRDLVFGLGPAGSGKTFLAVAYGLSLLQKKLVEKLVITRPAVEAGENLGFLPGDMNEKVDPYLTPIWQALSDIIGAEGLRKLREDGRIEVAPLAFTRGRTLSRAYIIVDEAQNTTRAQMKMMLTRIGEGSKMAVTGDPSQVDLPRKADTGLLHAVGLLGRLKGVAVARLTLADIVRHELVARIVRAYDNEGKTIQTTNQDATV